MVKELLGLIADVNPTEIASHIDQGNLHGWCNSWRTAAEQVVQKIDNPFPVATGVKSHLDKRDAEIILALAKYNMKVTEVANDMFMHRNSVIYRIQKIHRITGKNPLNFYELFDLTRIARRMLGGE